MTLLEVFVQRWDLLKVAFIDHMFLVFVAMAFATVISVSLGIILSSARKFAEFIIGITAVLQTIPSLALLGFMIPLVGIGKTNAIIALTAYALLPILRNTYTGIVEVDSAAVEAGKGMGMTRGQILRKIELPLALPIIMAGIRTATVITIGVATLATFVGAGGLGDLIMRGIQMQNTNLILVGAIPAALLALSSDFILKRIEKAATPQGLKKT
ncbi:ABC transporter permease [Bacillaceae bacterium IKA-2]|jgi:osmoprotectant transport system permease protein|nr:ABC transporter permease [Bacillaceae bacterium IKA-2]